MRVTGKNLDTYFSLLSWAWATFPPASETNVHAMILRLKPLGTFFYDNAMSLAKGIKEIRIKETYTLRWKLECHLGQGRPGGGANRWQWWPQQQVAAGQGTAVGLDIYQWKHGDPASKFLGDPRDSMNWCAGCRSGWASTTRKYVHANAPTNKMLARLWCSFFISRKMPLGSMSPTRPSPNSWQNVLWISKLKASCVTFLWLFTHLH